MTNFTVIFTQILKEKKITGKELANKTNISQSLISDYKNGKVEPSMTNIYKIAKYLGVSCDYLITGQTEQLHLNQEEKLLIKYYRNMSAEQKKGIMVTAETMYNAHPTGLSSNSKIG